MTLQRIWIPYYTMMRKEFVRIMRIWSQTLLPSAVTSSLFFTHLVVYNALVLLSAITLTSVLFSLGGLINGVFAKGFDGMSIVPTFVLTPLTYLGGIFYSISQFPPVWQKVSLVNPILYMVNAFRYGFLGISDVPVWICFGVLFGCIALFVGVILWLFRQGIGMRV